jgi:hypothetical protein
MNEKKIVSKEWVIQLFCEQSYCSDSDDNQYPECGLKMGAYCPITPSNIKAIDALFLEESSLLADLLQAAEKSIIVALAYRNTLLLDGTELTPESRINTDIKFIQQAIANAKGDSERIKGE